MKNQKFANMNYIALQNNYFFPPQSGYQQMGQMPGMIPSMMDQFQPNPYMMGQMPPQMGHMPYQQNLIQNNMVNQQFQQHEEVSNLEEQN